MAHAAPATLAARTTPQKITRASVRKGPLQLPADPERDTRRIPRDAAQELARESVRAGVAHHMKPGPRDALVAARGERAVGLAPLDLRREIGRAVAIARGDDDHVEWRARAIGEMGHAFI